MRSCLVCLFLIPAIADAQTPAEKAATLNYLASLQEANGSFRSDSRGGPSLRATSAAVRATTYLGGELAKRDAVSAYVLGHYDAASGGFAEGREAPNVLVTSIGILAAVDLGLPETQYPKAVDFLRGHAKSFEDVRIGAAALESLKKKPAWLDDWITIANNRLNNDGTAGKGDGLARDTASVVALKLRLRYPVANQSKVVAAILAGQRADGGWGQAGAAASDGETTYRVMRALMLAKEKPRDPARLREFLAKCRNADGGCGTAPGQPSSAAGTYYYAIVSKWLAAK